MIVINNYNFLRKKKIIILMCVVISIKILTIILIVKKYLKNKILIFNKKDE